MEKILEGSLARFEVPDLLTFLHMGRRTGCLVMERAGQETKAFLRDGKPVFATSSRDELRLGSMLVRLGKVRPEALDGVLSRGRAAGQRIGQVLLSEKILSEEELGSFLKVQVSEVIFDSFSWHEGSFTFYDKVSPPATAVTLEMDPQNLIMEGVRRTDERGRLNELFPDLEWVVEAVANPERVKHSMSLTQDEWRVFFLVDGRRTLADICRLAGNPDELATLQVLQHLVMAKFVEVVPPRPAAGAGPAPAGAPAARPAPEPSAEAPGTLRFGETAGTASSAPVSVEFQAPSPPRARVEDDTKEIVRPQAGPYLANATQVTMARLLLLKDGVESSFPLTRDAYSLGRHRNNDIVVSDAKVSSFHARIDRAPEGFQIVDLNSRNGTYVNGKRVPQALLATGDEVRLGASKLVYRVDFTSAVTP